MKIKMDENFCLYAKYVPLRSNWVKINSESGNQIKLQSNKHKHKHCEKYFQKVK